MPLGIGIGLSLTLGQNSGPTFDYYVDPATSTSGAGTVASPYTSAQMSALSGSVANKSIGLKRGSVGDGTVKPTITLSDSGIFIGVYGTGNGPIFECRKTISGAWTSLGSNIWRWTGTQESDSSASGNVFKNGVPMPLVVNSAALTTAGQALVSVWGWQGDHGITATTTFTVDIYSVADPTSDGNNYQFSAYLYGLNLSGNNIIVAGASDALITVKGSLHQSGGHRYTGDGNLYRNLRGEHGSRHCMTTGVNFDMANSQFYGGLNRQENGGADHLVCNKTTFGAGKTGVIRNTDFSGDTYLVAGTDNLAAFYSHDGSTGQLLTADLIDCTFGYGMIALTPTAQTTTLTRPVFTSAWRIVQQGYDTVAITIVDATGDVGSLLRVNNGSGTITLNTSGSVLTLTGAQFTTGQHFQIFQLANGVIDWTSSEDVFTCTDGTGTLRYVTNCAYLVASINNSQFLGTWDKMLAAYTSLTFTGNNNSYKSGADKWETPAGNDATLTAWKTRVSPQDSASVTI